MQLWTRSAQWHVNSGPTCFTGYTDAGRTTATETGSSCDPKSFQQTRSSKKWATIRRYPSVERVDSPRRRAAAATATATLAAGRSLLGADRKRAERFRRQYVDVKLQQRTAPETTKSMFTGIEKCGVSRHDSIASPQLLQVPATAIVTFTWLLVACLISYVLRPYPRHIITYAYFSFIYLFIPGKERRELCERCHQKSVVVFICQRTGSKRLGLHTGTPKNVTGHFVRTTSTIYYYESRTHFPRRLYKWSPRSNINRNYRHPNFSGHLIRWLHCV